MMGQDGGKRPLKVLVIDDEETSLRLCRTMLAEEGHMMTVAKTGSEGIQKVNGETYDLLILDLKLPDIYGTEVLKQIQARITWTPVIIITAHPSLESSIEAIRTGGVYEYIVKPFRPEDFKSAVRRVIEKSALMIENHRLLNRLERTNQVLIQRVDELENFAQAAVDYKRKIGELQARIKELEDKLR